MALTKISTDGVKDDAITKAKIPANQIEASELADNSVDSAALSADCVIGSKIADQQIATEHIVDQAVALSKLPHGDGSSDGKFLRANNGADPSFESVVTDLVGDSSPQLGGTLESNGNDIHLADNDHLYLGTGQDINIYHDSTDSYFYTGAGTTFFRTASNAKLASLIANGGVELYYNGNLKLETIDSGVTLTGKQIIEIGSTDSIGLEIHSNQSVKPTITMDSNRSAAHNTIGSISGKWNGNEVTRIATEAGRDTTNKDDGIIVFSTTKSGGSLRPASWISSNGIFYVSADAQSNNNWATFVISPRNITDITNYNGQSYGLARCVRNIHAGSSTTQTSLIRVMRYYWGHGFYKITLKQHYYSSVNEASWYLYGHGRYDGSYNPNYSLGHHNVEGSINSNVLSISTSQSSPSHGSTEYVDIIANVPAYEQFTVEIEISTIPQRADSVTSTFHDVNCYALH